MARPTLDAETDGGGASANSLTYAHPCSADADILVVSVAASNGSGSLSCTYNGVSMTLLVGYDSHPSKHNRSALFYLLSPASGSNNVVASAPGANRIASGAISLEGVDTGDPIEDSGSDSATSGTSLSVTLATDEDTYMVSVMATGGSAPTGAGSGETEYLSNPSLSFFHANGTRKDGTASDEDVSRTFSSISSRGASLLVLAVRGAAASTSPIIGVGRCSARVVGALVATGDLAGTARARSRALGAAAGTGSLAGSTRSVGPDVGSLVGTGALAGVGRSAARGAASVTGLLEAAGSTYAVALVTGRVSGTGALVGATRAASRVSALLVGTGALTGVARAGARAGGTLTSGVNVAEHEIRVVRGRMVRVVLGGATQVKQGRTVRLTRGPRSHHR